MEKTIDNTEEREREREREKKKNGRGKYIKKIIFFCLSRIIFILE